VIYDITGNYNIRSISMKTKSIQNTVLTDSVGGFDSKLRKLLD
jgi:hypothetical protein